MPMLNGVCSSCPGMGADEPKTDTESILGKLIEMYGQAGANALVASTLPKGYYQQSAAGDITYVQPEGSTALVPFVAGATVTKAQLQAAAGAPLSDTSTVWLIGLGIGAVVLFIWAGRRR